MRLIDADALKEKVFTFAPLSETNIPVSEVRALIDAAKTYTPPPVPHISKNRAELLASPYDMLTAEEKVRYHRCKAIPPEVVALCEEEQGRLRQKIRFAATEHERKLDKITDFLNGYDLTPDETTDIPF